MVILLPNKRDGPGEHHSESELQFVEADKDGIEAAAFTALSLGIQCHMMQCR